MSQHALALYYIALFRQRERDRATINRKCISILAIGINMVSSLLSRINGIVIDVDNNHRISTEEVIGSVYWYLILDEI